MQLPSAHAMKIPIIQFIYGNMCNHHNIQHLVKLRFPKGDDVLATCSVTTLVVVIVDEDQSVVARRHAPRFAYSSRKKKRNVVNILGTTSRKTNQLHTLPDE
jgi:hypothetical protein